MATEIILLLSSYGRRKLERSMSGSYRATTTEIMQISSHSTTMMIIKDELIVSRMVSVGDSQDDQEVRHRDLQLAWAHNLLN